MREWKKRKRGFSVGRICHASSTFGEFYYLRVLLTKVKGPRSFDEIRTVDGVPYPTFREARFAMGLLDDDKEYIFAIKEASTWAPGQYLRRMFNALRLEAARLIESLNEEQLHIFNHVMSVLEHQTGGFFFVYGYGRTGKTFLWNALTSTLRSNGEIVLTVASSGIAATLLPSGRTAHSRFAIPIHVHEYSMCSIKQNSPISNLIEKMKLIIWDEAPMVQCYCIEAFDRTLKDIMHCSAPFGGKCIVMGGDFRQILPVIPKGNGHLGEANDGIAEIDIPLKLLISSYTNPIQAIVASTYPNLLENLHKNEYFNDRAILAPTIEHVYQVNDYMCSLLPGETFEFLSCDTVCRSDEDIDSFNNLYTTEFLNTISCSGLPPHKLILKVGAPIMLLRNIDQSACLCNGTRMCISKLGKNVIEAIILSGSNPNQKVLLHRMDINPSESRWPFRMKRRQFPITLSFAMTINKSQGQSLRSVGLFLTKPVFAHGQLYVALSRVKSIDGLKIIIDADRKNMKSTTTNVVYKEIFRNL
ncbi:ATP-dependent DNA helicase PIF1-like [Neltuma alba]|uniref:ATP-dependent DNA helicase PIF1-like n=1 Tax=Neltuma alba TaxID=207710 RepID=UPI0010A523A0|nr:ATP-dependent DNA helicase PIF1-like [Prosopis alba]